MLREPWRTRLLFLSFAVNLVAIPMAGSRYLMHPSGHGPGTPPPPQVMIQRMGERLSAADAEKLRMAMASHVEDIDVARARMRAARSEMNRLLLQPEFDRAATAAAMTRWQDQWQVWSRAVGDAMLDAYAGMSPDGRRNLADRPPRRP